MVKALVERLMVGGQSFLEERPPKGNGYYTRDLLTLYGPVDDLRVPRVREGGPDQPSFRSVAVQVSIFPRPSWSCTPRGWAPGILRFLEPMYIALGIKPGGRREVLGFWLFGREGKSARNWEEVLKDLRKRGRRGCGSS